MEAGVSSGSLVCRLFGSTYQSPFSFTISTVIRYSTAGFPLFLSMEVVNVTSRLVSSAVPVMLSNVKFWGNRLAIRLNRAVLAFSCLFRQDGMQSVSISSCWLLCQ